MSTQPSAFSSFDWPPVTALPGLALRAVWRHVRRVVGAAWHGLIDPANRRTLTVLPLVLLGHLLLIWLLIQNRWIVMSTTTVTVMPPIMASIVLSGERARPGAADDRAAPWGKQKGSRGDTDADLKPSFELSMGAPRVQRSVPWLNTELLPELRGNSADPTADQLERTEAGAKRPPAAAKAEAKPRSTAARQQLAKAPAKPNKPKVRSQTLQAGASSPTPRPGEDPLLRIPPPPAPAVALIPPPPAVNDLPWTPVPLQPPPPTAEMRPSAPIQSIQSIPEPVNAAPRDIPPLWSPQAAPPPPKLVAIPPPPPVLKTIPPPVVAQQPEPTAPSIAPVPMPTPGPVSPPSPARPVPVPAPARVAVTPAPAPTPPPTPPPSVAAVVTAPAPAPSPAPSPVPPPEPTPAPPLALTPSPVLPAPSVAPAVTMAPATVLVPATAAPGAVVSPAAAVAPSVPDMAPARNPMVVEVPRYRLAEPGGAATGTPQAAGGVAADGAEGRGSRSGPAGSAQGSALGLGAASPAPLPVASASGTAPANKSLNLSLPRVEVYRSGIGPVRQPSFADQANAQLRRGAPKDPMAEAINSAETPDCLKDSGMGLLGAPVAAYKAMTGKCK